MPAPATHGPAGAGRELLEPRPRLLNRRCQRALQQRPRLKRAFRADRRGREVGDGKVGDVMVQRGPVALEEAAELSVGGDVTALGRRQAGRMPGPGGKRAVLGPLDARQRAGEQRTYLIMAAAQGEHGGRGQAGRRGDGLHLVRGGGVAGLAGRGERLVPTCRHAVSLSAVGRPAGLTEQSASRAEPHGVRGSAARIASSRSSARLARARSASRAV
jgi:hypothetical protein